jgi:hypothetical protein
MTFPLLHIGVRLIEGLVLYLHPLHYKWIKVGASS